VVRMGGEEFGILFPECHIDEALIALERIRKRFESSSTMADGKLIFVTVSIGVAAFTGAEEKDTEVVERADRALYAAKAEGRNQIVVGL